VFFFALSFSTDLFSLQSCQAARWSSQVRVLEEPPHISSRARK
jgi:hypothetical protein